MHMHDHRHAAETTDPRPRRQRHRVDVEDVGPSAADQRHHSRRRRRDHPREPDQPDRGGIRTAQDGARLHENRRTELLQIVVQRPWSTRRHRHLGAALQQGCHRFEHDAVGAVELSGSRDDEHTHGATDVPTTRAEGFVDDGGGWGRWHTLMVPQDRIWSTAVGPFRTWPITQE